MSILSMGTAPKPLGFLHFPTAFQAVVWRNWAIVPMERLAEILETSVDNIIRTGKEMGLEPPGAIGEEWLKRGYLTIIRANWHLLNYDQLLRLLCWTETELAYALKEDDFLWHKLGHLKPDCEPVRYRELSSEEKKATAEMRNIVAAEFGCSTGPTVHPFDFLKTFYSPDAPDRIQYSDTAVEDEIKLDEEWAIANSGGDPAIDLHIERFLENHSSVFGIKPVKSQECDISKKSGKKIVLTKAQINPDNSVPEESHSIRIQRELIEIVAPDTNGLMRGLQWLEKEMEMRKGPFLRIRNVERRTRFDFRMLFTYFGIFGDLTSEPEYDPYPDGLLQKLSKTGVNAVWLQAILYKLLPFPWDPSLSEGWEARLESLRKLIKRAAQYGIKVYLYLNEPRSMPLSFFEKHPKLMGSIEDENAALCTSLPEVKDYLRNSVKMLFTELYDLGGVFTITMSENLTNCYSRVREQDIKCPRCAERPAYEVVAEVNTIIAEAARSVKPDARVICWTWAWKPEWSQKVIGLLPEYADIMCPSEEQVKTLVAGVESKVIDYSISNPGPGELSSLRWKTAAERGMRTVAKVQFNNTWECSAVPYIPALNLIEKHIGGLAEKGVNGLMLSWTLGGYPALNLEFVSQYFWETTITAEGKAEVVVKEGLPELAARKYGINAADKVVSAWNRFSTAFREFPFDLTVLYTAPQNYGPKNLLFMEPTGYRATMVGFPYDDLRTWRAMYPEDIFEEQFRKLSDGWLEGIELLKEARGSIDISCTKAFNELCDVSEALYCHFRSTYLQVAFIRARARKDYELMKQLAGEELGTAKKLLSVTHRDSRIGFEASNHYYYTSQDLMEKVLNCRDIIRQLDEYKC